METRVEESERLENEYRTGNDRFYERFGHAEALGYKWEYQPPTIKPREDYSYEYGTD